MTAIHKFELFEESGLDEGILEAGVFGIGTDASEPLNEPGTDVVIAVMNPCAAIPLPVLPGCGRTVLDHVSPGRIRFLGGKAVDEVIPADTLQILNHHVCASEASG